ncbi:sprouty-related, EVH1 domain-containing protein 3 [Pristis pectinata]|uniref:sprouty-related, EVH1 domain-containing protein 3 n=1 Tax=Pristis pectinata TaxID=685728 RepID=UPI00223DF250|nr:sprouty-related, EVH1 domain-containing protein 3 [Pristis pectinata]
MDQDYVVRVRAVVMTRDDSSGGWVPLGGPGLSHVTIARTVRSDTSSQGSFLIRGERLRDEAVILECRLKRDLVYNKVNPIFHHWKVDDDKFGLTFQSPADAVNFERSIQSAIGEMSEGSLTSSSPSQGEADAAEDVTATHTDSESSPNSRKEMLPKHITIVTSESSSSCYIRSPVSDEFWLGHTEAATPHSQVPGRTPRRQQQEEEEELEAVHKELWVAKGYEDYRRAGPPGGPDKLQLCVHFAKGEGREAAAAGGGGPTPASPSPSPSPACRVRGPASPRLKKGEGEAAPARCVYCRDVFRAAENGRGRCQDAPDPVRRCVHQVSCMWCAESLLYHCMADSEGDYSDPCSCDPGSRHFCARWLALAALSLMAPCMCCYLPLQACHRCGERWGCCGGKHKAVR